MGKWCRREGCDLRRHSIKIKQMKEISILKITSDVAAVLGEPTVLDCQPEESPFPGLEDRVRIEAPEVLSVLIKEADVSGISDAKPMTGDVVVEADGVVRLPLTSDFLRLVSVRMSDWRRPVNEITGRGESKYSFQASEFSGVCGNPSRPVAIIGYDKGGNRCLELHSSGAGARLSYCLYLPAPVVSQTDTLEVPDAMYESLIKRIASNIAEDAQNS